MAVEDNILATGVDDSLDETITEDRPDEELRRIENRVGLVQTTENGNQNGSEDGNGNGSQNGNLNGTANANANGNGNGNGNVRSSTRSGCWSLCLCSYSKWDL